MGSEVPDRIGAFEVRRRLGAGGMGEVFLAWDDRLKRHVAIKRIRHDVETTPERRRRFRREARAAAGLSHPAIVQIHDILEDESGEHIVMEYVEGRTLAELLAEGSVGGAAALRLARQVAEGLARAHGHGLVHRDLKAENVMVTPDGQAKILDFGLVKHLPREDLDESLTREGAVVGTVRAMSPEQAGGEEVDARSDLFSLGVLLYEMVTGRSPFRGENLLQVQKLLLTAQPPPPRALRPELPAELSELIEALLEKDPGRRPRSAREVAGTLREIAAGPGLDDLAPASPSPTREASSDAPTVPGRSPSPAVPGPGAGRGDGVERKSAAAAEPPRVRRRWPAAAALTALAVLALLAVFWFSFPRPLRVAVLEPELTAEVDGRFDAVALGVVEEVLGTLFSLRALEVLDPALLERVAGSPEEAARLLEADELLRTRIACGPASCRVWFRRVSLRQGVAGRAAGGFSISRRREDSLDLANAVRAHLRLAYPGRRWRSGTGARLEVRRQDYEAYFGLRDRAESGASMGEAELRELEGVIAGSPAFPGAYLLAAQVARVLERFDRARELVARAAELAPWDPRPLSLEVQLALLEDRVEEAAATLGKLERIAPGDLRVWRSRARLLDRQGRTREALAEWRRVVDRQPSWQNLGNLADLEMRLGRIGDARAHLDRLLEVSADNAWGLGKLAELEILFGDLQRAEELYLRLTEIDPQDQYWNNLGFARFLLGRYASAVESYRRALESDPTDLRTRLNLAGALLAAGRAEEARELYQQLLDELEGEALDAETGMFQALCLARLGESRRAVEAAERALELDAGEVQVLFQAALVFAEVGQRVDALVNAEKALALGFNPRRFEIPGFDVLRDDPEFQALMATYRPASP